MCFTLHLMGKHCRVSSFFMSSTLFFFIVRGNLLTGGA